MLTYISIFLGIIIFLAFIYVAIVSVKEKQKRAVRVSVLSSFILSAPFILAAFLNIEILYLTLFVITAIILIVLFFPTGTKKIQDSGKPNSQIDERNIVFLRRLLKKETERFENYYKENPSNLKPDEDFRSKAGLMSKGSTEFDNIIFKSAETCFDVVRLLHKGTNGEISNIKNEVDALKITNYIKNWAKKLGAISVGVTELKEHHFYSHHGRECNYAEEVKNNHKFAIAFTVEMDKKMMATAPKAPTVLESAHQYVNAGLIAVTISSFIRKMGYPAQAHIDESYDVLCPPIAEDAGLGTIGRLGLLMTPELGPRVRLSVVTTDLPLIIDKNKNDNSVISFCEKCKKCANICPTNAIPFDEQKIHNGVKKWQIDQDACFKFWCISGTDCGRCVTVCPYSHPNNTFHNFIRWGIKNSFIFSSFALIMEDLFYGKKPSPADVESWMQVG
ncbi:MAG: 4Fe-4S dicluster domain-containing protein [Saprospiraceae bacterium]|nr:4Fe-4S dicluster domain-containing protein [Saprospiraceae bacterium]